jgi:hypothetical protein
MHQLIIGSISGTLTALIAQLLTQAIYREGV